MAVFGTLLPGPAAALCDSPEQIAELDAFLPDFGQAPSAYIRESRPQNEDYVAFLIAGVEYYRQDSVNWYLHPRYVLRNTDDCSIAGVIELQPPKIGNSDYSMSFNKAGGQIIVSSRWYETATGSRYTRDIQGSSVAIYDYQTLLPLLLRDYTHHEADRPRDLVFSDNGEEGVYPCGVRSVCRVNMANLTLSDRLSATDEYLESIGVVASQALVINDNLAQDFAKYPHGTIALPEGPVIAAGGVDVLGNRRFVNYALSGEPVFSSLRDENGTVRLVGIPEFEEHFGIDVANLPHERAPEDIGQTVFVQDKDRTLEIPQTALDELGDEVTQPHELNPFDDYQYSDATEAGKPAKLGLRVYVLLAAIFVAMALVIVALRRRRTGQ